MEPINNKQVLEWLLNRGITKEVLQSAQISWNGNEIVIPIFDMYGNHVFNKYRRSPFNSDGPKYRYEKGSTSTLYNLQTIKNAGDNPIFICEGEFDCLLLNSLGLYAVTSTGGCGTFNKEWGDLFFEKDVFIVFDKDDAGYKGAMKVQGIIPHAKVIFFGQDIDGNDITDYFQNHSLNDFFKLPARSYPIPREPSDMPQKKKDLKTIVDSFGDAGDELLKIRKEMFANRENVHPVDIMLTYVNSRYETFSHILKSRSRRFDGTGNSGDVIRAKHIPITEILTFNYDGFAKCVWHNEKTASMKYNNADSKYPNTVKCFGCGMMGDSIDVVMEYYNLDFQGAINFLLKDER